MHIITKVLIIVNLLACLILTQYVWVSLAGNVQWRARHDAERQQRNADKAALERAYNKLLAVRATGDNRARQDGAELASLRATRQALQAWSEEADKALEDAEATAENLLAGIADFRRILTDYDSQLTQSLRDTMTELNRRRNNLYQQRNDELLAVAQAHNVYAEKHEQYRRLEYQRFLLEEEYSRRAETQSIYRWLRPDIQKELGDSGPVIFAEVTWVHGSSLQINKGRRDGVERHQKYTIMRNGSTIAVVDVVDPQNETSECVIVDVVAPGMAPQRGDEAVTRLFMARMGR